MILASLGRSLPAVLQLVVVSVDITINDVQRCLIGYALSFKVNSELSIENAKLSCLQYASMRLKKGKIIRLFKLVLDIYLKFSCRPTDPSLRAVSVT